MYSKTVIHCTISSVYAILTTVNAEHACSVCLIQYQLKNVKFTADFFLNCESKD